MNLSMFSKTSSYDMWQFREVLRNKSVSINCFDRRHLHAVHQRSYQPLCYLEQFLYDISNSLFLCEWKCCSGRSVLPPNPHVFVIATCVWSEMIIYLLVSCNKQLFLCLSLALDLFLCLDTSSESEGENERIGCVKTEEGVERKRTSRKVAYYNLPRGKWSSLITHMLRWRKRADRWQHWSARATLSLTKATRNKKHHTCHSAQFNDVRVEVIHHLSVVSRRSYCTSLSNSSYSYPIQSRRSECVETTMVSSARWSLPKLSLLGLFG